MRRNRVKPIALAFGLAFRVGLTLENKVLGADGPALAWFFGCQPNHGLTLNFQFRPECQREVQLFAKVQGVALQ